MPHEPLPPLLESPRGSLLRERKEKKEEQDRLTCEAEGGTWDHIKKVCIAPELKGVETQGPKADPDLPEVGEIEGTTLQTLTLPDGRTFRGLNRDDIRLISQQQAQQGPIPGTERAGTAQRRADIGFQGQQLAGQVGQFGQLPTSPTGLDVGEAVTTGIIGAIPRAISLAAGGAALGAAGGTAIAPGLGTVAGAAIGAAGGFLSGLAGAMIGNFKSQRSDTTTAQQRTLDEGKQTLMDWVTLARADPVNRNFYLAQYNQQSAQINQAFRQMKLDTSRDLAKFETALPNLAEFNTFYSEGGERDSLNQEMINALNAPLPEGYDLFALAKRREDEKEE